MLLLAPSPLSPAEFLGGAVAVLVLLAAAGGRLTRILRKLPRPRSPLLRLALGDLTRPGAATGGVITALGLGLTLLATVTLLDRTIAAEVNEAPSQPRAQLLLRRYPARRDRSIRPHHRRFQERQDYKRTPMIRGRITALNGVPSARRKSSSDAKWVLNRRSRHHLCRHAAARHRHHQKANGGRPTIPAPP